MQAWLLIRYLKQMPKTAEVVLGSVGDEVHQIGDIEQGLYNSDDDTFGSIFELDSGTNAVKLNIRKENDDG